MRRRARNTVTCLLVVGLAGCTLGSSERVEEVDADILEGLSEPTGPTTTALGVPASAVDTTIELPPGPGPTPVPPNGATTQPTTPTTVETTAVTVYFVSGSMLVPIEARVEAPARLRRKLAVLEVGPPEQAPEGVRTAVLAGLVNGVEIGDDAVTVDLDGEVFADVDPSDQRLIFGQIVLTVTADPDYPNVRFTLDDEPLRVFLRDNTLGEPGEPVARRDYDRLLDRGVPATAPP